VKIVWGIVLGFLIAVFTKTATDASSQEMRTRLERLPQTLMGWTARLLPDDVLEDLLDEWTAELMFILRYTEGLPLTRLWRGIRFASSLMLSGPALGKDQAIGERIGRAALSLVGCGSSTVGILMLAGRFGYVSELIWDVHNLTQPYGLLRLDIWAVVNDIGSVFTGLSAIFLGLATVVSALIPWSMTSYRKTIRALANVFTPAFLALSVGGLLGGVAGIGITPGSCIMCIAEIGFGILVLTAVIFMRTWSRKLCSQLNTHAEEFAG
jgi:hypothetical protein